MVGISLFLEKKKGKIVYTIFFILAFALFITNNIYYSMTNTFFDFSLIMLAGEGSDYFMDAILNCNIWVYISSVVIIISYIFGLKQFKERKKTDLKKIIKVFFLFLILHLITPLFLGKPNDALTWSTWRNPRNIYINFNDNNKSMMVSGIYEYSVRNFYITFIKAKKTDNEEDITFLKEEYNKEEENYQTNYTGKFKDKNVIFLQLEGTDNWLITKEDTPTLYNMMNNSINFTNHYSYYNGGGSTFNSEFAVNTGFITPLSYTQNAYSFNKNSFPYSLAKLLKNENYSVNAFHMNDGEYYSRATNYKNWGYDNYYGLKELGTYKDDSYTLDRELILNETFKEKMFSEEKFADYIITYSGHLPFTTEKGVCKKLVTEDILKEQGLDKLTDEEIKINVISKFKSDELKIKYLDKLTDEKYKSIVISSFESDKLKIEYLDKLTDERYKTSVITKFKSDELKIKYLDRIKIKENTDKEIVIKEKEKRVEEVEKVIIKDDNSNSLSRTLAKILIYIIKFFIICFLVAPLFCIIVLALILGFEVLFVFKELP